jgi:hypothetical protein
MKKKKIRSLNQIEEYFEDIRTPVKIALPKLKRKIDLSKFYLRQESIDLRYAILYKLIHEINHIRKLKYNITKRELFSLLTFARENAYKVIQCDKNVGIMIISISDLDKLAKDHLENNLTYRTLDKDETSSITLEINNQLEELYTNKNISKRVYKYQELKEQNRIRAGKFRILAKIHKEKFGIRPIINCINHPTEKLCSIIDSLLQPLVKSIKTILKDSHTITTRNGRIYIRIQVFLASCDFDSLYTNMKPEDTINRISEYLVKNDYLNVQDFDIEGIRAMLKLIFTKNIFRYRDKYYLQCIGIPIGCRCGPSIANLYLYTLEKSYLSLNPDIIYKRFIDDIFIASPKQIDKHYLCNQFKDLKLNIAENSKVNFLDLEISMDKLTKKLKFSLYIKPTNNFSYLLATSNHPKLIFNNIPVSLFIRIRRICTNFHDYLFFASLLVMQLVKRGY